MGANFLDKAPMSEYYPDFDTKREQPGAATLANKGIAVPVQCHKYVAEQPLFPDSENIFSDESRKVSGSGGR
jgi:hypothetical protein